MEQKLNEIVALLQQILKELKIEGPEEKSKPIGGFRTNDDSPF